MGSLPASVERHHQMRGVALAIATRIANSAVDPAIWSERPAGTAGTILQPDVGRLRERIFGGALGRGRVGIGSCCVGRRSLDPVMMCRKRRRSHAERRDAGREDQHRHPSHRKAPSFKLRQKQHRGQSTFYPDANHDDHLGESLVDGTMESECDARMKKDPVHAELLVETRRGISFPLRTSNGAVVANFIRFQLKRDLFLRATKFVVEYFASSDQPRAIGSLPDARAANQPCEGA